MTRKPVHLAVYDTYADWETGHATAHLARGGSPDPDRRRPPGEPVASMGGLRVLPDLRARPTLAPRTARC